MMQKPIRLFAVLATVLMGASLVLMVASVPLQKMIATELYQYSADIIRELPRFPWIPFFSGLLYAGCTALLILCCGNQKSGIWLEILVIVLLATVLPAITTFASKLYSTILGSLGLEKIAANSFVSMISSFCNCPASLGKVLAYIVCGMSITLKVISKKQSVESINL